MKNRTLLMEADPRYLGSVRTPGVFITPAMRAVAESIATKFESGRGLRDGWENPRLPWKKILGEALANPHTLQEASGVSAFGQLMRVGIQMNANSWYRKYPTTYQKIASEVASDKRQEFYAPLFGANRPQEVKAGTPFREQAPTGQDLELINKKFGAIEAFERELFDDDQTGQIAQRAQRLGESMAMWEDQYFSRRFIGAANTDFKPTTIAASRWTGVNPKGTAISTPFNEDMYLTKADGSQHIGNRPHTFAQFNFSGLLRAFQRLRQAKDPMGQAMVVNPNTLLVSTFDELNARTAVGSPVMPGVQGRADSTETASTAAAGFFRGWGAMNPVQGEFTVVCNIHLAGGVWALGEGGKGYIFQRRDPMEIAQELPLSGESFILDVYRFRSRARWEQDWIDPRFWFLGCDDSLAASVSQ